MDMKREDVGEQLVIERYLKGKLDRSEEEAFEERYLYDPDLVEQLELAERLEDGLAELEKRGELRRARARRKLSILGTPQYAAAASVLLVGSLIVSALLYVENAELRGSARAVTATPSYRVLPLYSVRGAGGDAVIPRAGEDEVLVLLVDPGPSGYDTFRATVRRVGGPPEIVWVSPAAEPGYEESLAVGVPGERLPPGDYEVLIEGIAEDAAARQVARVPFRIEDAP